MYIYIYMHTNTHTLHIHTHICMHAGTHTHTWSHMHAPMHTHSNKHAHLTHTHSNKHAHLTHTHTHTHIHNIPPALDNSNNPSAALFWSPNVTEASASTETFPPADPSGSLASSTTGASGAGLISVIGTAFVLSATTVTSSSDFSGLTFLGLPLRFLPVAEDV